MTEPGGVTVGDTVSWLHDEGLIRLSCLGERALSPIAAYTVDVATGTVMAYPATGGGVGSEITTHAADDLPHPVGTPKRLVVVGVTTSEAVLIVDLATSVTLSINSDRPEYAARSWILQLLLNPDVTISTNSADIAIGDSPRCRRSFIPGGSSTIVNIDDMNPPLTTVTFNADDEGPDHLDILGDGTGEMYLGARFWPLRQVMTVGDKAWNKLVDQMSGGADTAGPVTSSGAGPSSGVAASVADAPPRVAPPTY
ncbi:hypothetical protein [Nocardia veterana]|uniref:hypothetical protein n=1 Tax=Nocardia veterana TaxID=132249 RepID=UPI0002F46E56|nr:hypothetical protein [Nocardia veterana]